MTLQQNGRWQLLCNSCSELLLILLFCAEPLLAEEGAGEAYQKWAANQTSIIEKWLGEAISGVDRTLYAIFIPLGSLLLAFLLYIAYLISLHCQECGFRREKGMVADDKKRVRVIEEEFVPPTNDAAMGDDINKQAENGVI